MARDLNMEQLGVIV